MSFDWYMDSDLSSSADINDCVEGRNRFAEVINIYSRTKLLAICLKSDNLKSYAKSGDKFNDPGGHKLIVCREDYNRLISVEIDRLKRVGLDKPLDNITTLPKYSFFLQFKFTLATPYISRDDEEFYICDNPTRKDKVFKVPMVSGSSWKGNMRWTAGKDIELITENPNEKLLKRIQLVKLFGNENEAEERYFNFLLSQEMVDKFKKEIKHWTNNGGLRRGRLNFYPTFFNQIGLEVINPHDRKTKAGTQPIYIESVPEGASGTFSLLYMPFDLMGRRETVVKDEVMKDLELIFPAIKKMMHTFGFSAKKSSGFGIAREDIKGTFKMSGVSIYKTYLPQEQKIDDSNPFAKLATLKKSLPPEEVKDDNFSSFRELGQLINRVKEKVIKNDK